MLVKGASVIYHEIAQGRHMSNRLNAAITFKKMLKKQLNSDIISTSMESTHEIITPSQNVP